MDRGPHASSAAPIWQVTPGETMQSRMQLHYDGAEVNLSAMAKALPRAPPIAQLKPRSAGDDGAPCPTCDHSSCRWAPALLCVSASLSHKPAQGWFCFCSCTGLLLFESAVLLRPPSIWDTPILLPFAVSNRSACVDQAGLTPSHSPFVSAGTGATAACMVQLSYCDPRRVIPGTTSP